MTDTTLAPSDPLDVATTEFTKEEATNHTEIIKAAIESINTKLEEVSEMLLQAKQRGADRALGYANWEEYIRTEFHMSRSRSYQLIDKARIMLELERAIDGETDEITMPHLTTTEIGVVKDDLQEVVTEIQERTKDAEPEDVAEIVQEVVQEAKTRRASNGSGTTKIEPQPVVPEAAEVEDDVIDGELMDEKDGHLQAAANRLFLLLDQIRDYPEPEELMPYMSEAHMNLVMKARLWLLRFTVEMPK